MSVNHTSKQVRMALKINNVYKLHVWNEWNMRTKLMAKHSVRNHFYPHKMDVLDEMSKKMEQCRRDAVKYVDTMKLIKWRDINFEELQIWRFHTTRISDYTQQFASHIANDDFSTFIETVVTMENERWAQLESKMAVRVQAIREADAVEGLMMLQKKAHQENAKQEKAKQEKAKQEKAKQQKEKQSIPPRRSSRIANQ